MKLKIPQPLKVFLAFLLNNILLMLVFNVGFNKQTMIISGVLSLVLFLVIKFIGDN